MGRVPEETVTTPDDEGLTTHTVPNEVPVPSDRPIMAFFDVDNTLMRGTSLFHLGREAWARKIIGAREIARFAWHQRRFISVGENQDHLDSARDRALGLARGHKVAEINSLAEQIWEHRIKKRLYPDTVGLTQEHIAKGHEVWLVSATPVEIGTVMAKHLGLTGALGTVVEAVDGIYTGRLVGHTLHAERKAEAARELAATAGADLRDCWAYSDSRNDIPLLEMVGNPVVVNPDAALARHAELNGWPMLRLTPRSIRGARRRVRREARRVRKSARRADPAD
jgi:HAD superfamily hydrolase (TIGR01490 family)